MRAATVFKYAAFLRVAAAHARRERGELYGRVVFFAVILGVFASLWHAVAEAGMPIAADPKALVWYLAITEWIVLSAPPIHIDIQEVVHPELDAQLVSENVALQLEKRVAFRRAMKKAVQSAVRLGAEGIRIACAGRLGGAEIARREWYRDGRVPLQTLRADLDFGVATAHTTYGTIGVKVWVFKGEVLPAARAAELG